MFCGRSAGGRGDWIRFCWVGKEQNGAKKIFFVELDENHEKTHFCGTTLYQPLPKANGRFAPKPFIENAEGMFLPHTSEEQKALMEAHCVGIKTDKVVCYCVPCTKGIQAGGKQGIHLMDLLLHADQY